MAITFNTKTLLSRSNRRELPTLFEKNKKLRRYRLIGDDHIPPPECDRSICAGTIGCGKEGEYDCFFQVSCD